MIRLYVNTMDSTMDLIDKNTPKKVYIMPSIFILIDRITTNTIPTCIRRRDRIINNSRLKVSYYVIITNLDVYEKKLNRF
jgi:hypothetical protein